MNSQELVTWREQLGLNQRQAAAMIGMSLRGYQKLEGGEAPIGERTALAVLEARRARIREAGIEGSCYLFFVHSMLPGHAAAVTTTYLVLARNSTDAQIQVEARADDLERDSYITVELASDLARRNQPSRILGRVPPPMANSAPLPDWYIDDLKETIARYKEMLEPLESGKIRIGDKNVLRPDLDPTQARIHSLKRQIAELQAMVDKRSV